MTSSHERSVRLDAVMPVIRERLASGQTVRFSPKGASMLPMLRQGIDSVELSPPPERLKKYDLPLYQRPDGQYALRRVAAVKESYTCIGDNQFVEEPGVSHEQVIAMMTSFTRGRKSYTVHSPAYRLYCRLWCGSRPIRRLYRRIAGRLRRWLR